MSKHEHVVAKLPTCVCWQLPVDSACVSVSALSCLVAVNVVTVFCFHHLHRAELSVSLSMLPAVCPISVCPPEERSDEESSPVLNRFTRKFSCQP